MTEVRAVGLLIVGGGPAGLAAAVAAWDAGCRDLLILERDDRLGGILQQCIHNGFGLHRFKEELTGPEYAGRYISQVLERGIPWQCGTMVLEITPGRLVTAVSPAAGLQQFQAGAVILAMGCRERPRGALGIPGTRCAGIMTTGTAQRLVNLEGYLPGRRIVILGSGDIGLIMARRMTCEGAEVLACVEIMPFSSGLTRNVVQCLQDYDIPLLLNHTVVDIQGRERLEGVTVAAVDPATRLPLPGTERQYVCDTLLLSVGLIPENELSRQAGVSLAEATQGPCVDQHLATSVPGIFACGNVLHVHDLVDEVSEESARAGRSAATWLSLAAAPAESPAGITVVSQGESPAERPAAAPAESPRPIRVLDGRGVRGVVPQTISRPLPAGPVRLGFRPDAIFRHATIRIEADGKTIFRQNRLIMAPGEMAVLDLPAERLAAANPQTLTVAVEVKHV